jgi:hypothetical protein
MNATVRSGNEGVARGGIRSSGAWLVAIGLGLAGCGENYGSATTYPVKGTVLLPDGKPLSSGKVTLVSDETALSYSGTIGSDGGFVVKNGLREGAPAGNYKVRVEVEETSLPKAKKGRPLRLPFPPRYADEDTSKLTASVKPGDNSFEFKLLK